MAPVLNLLELDGSLNYGFGSFTAREPGLILDGVDELPLGNEAFPLHRPLLQMPLVYVVIGLEDLGNSLLLAIHQGSILLLNRLNGLLDRL